MPALNLDATCLNSLLFLPIAAIFLEDLILGGRDEFILLLSLRLFDYLVDSRVRILNRPMFHTSTLPTSTTKFLN